MQMYIFTRAILWLPNISRSKCSSVHDIVLTAMWHLILDWQGLLAAAQLKERKKLKEHLRNSDSKQCHCQIRIKFSKGLVKVMHEIKNGRGKKKQ